MLFTYGREDVLKPNKEIIWAPIFQCTWLGADLNTDTNKTCVRKKIGPLTHYIYMLILGSIANLIWGTYMTT